MLTQAPGSCACCCTVAPVSVLTAWRLGLFTAWSTHVTLTGVCWPAVGSKHAGPAHHDLTPQCVNHDCAQLLGARHGNLRGTHIAHTQHTHMQHSHNTASIDCLMCVCHMRVPAGVGAAHMPAAAWIWVRAGQLTLSALRLSLWKSSPPQVRSMRAPTMPAFSIPSSTSTLWLEGPRAHTSLLPAQRQKMRWGGLRQNPTPGHCMSWLAGGAACQVEGKTHL